MSSARISPEQLAVVDWLLRHGLAQSARTLLGKARDRASNERRRSAESVSPVAGVYVLVTRDDGSQVWSLPAQSSTEQSLPSESLARRALEDAVGVVRAVRGEFHYARVGLTASAHQSIEGASVGLAAALALDAWLVGDGPSLPVFATGALLSESVAIGPVDFVGEKVRHALDELGDEDGIVLAPFVPEGVNDARVCAVRTYQEAATRVFGPGERVVAARHQDLRGWLGDLAKLHPVEALRHLDAVDPKAEAGADEALIRMHRGNHLRHAGRTEEARREHDEARRVAQTVRLDRASHEQIRFQIWNTQLDFFDFDEAIAALEKEPLHELSSPANELLFRGTLSRALAMRGDFAAALRHRSDLMPMHEISSELRKSLGWSLNEWMLVAGLARRPDCFEEALRRASSLGADAYSTQSVIRASVLLGRDQVACAWYDGQELACALPWKDLEARTHAGEHPCVSVARALMRALRRSGRGEESVALAGRMTRTAHGLVAWLGWTVAVEGALALRALGRLGDAERELALAREGLRVAHPNACRHHETLLVGGWEAVDAELERIFY
jgi:hypothetical protein